MQKEKTKNFNLPIPESSTFVVSGCSLDCVVMYQETFPTKTEGIKKCLEITTTINKHFAFYEKERKNKYPKVTFHENITFSNKHVSIRSLWFWDI